MSDNGHNNGTSVDTFTHSRRSLGAPYRLHFNRHSRLWQLMHVATQRIITYGITPDAAMRSALGYLQNAG